MPDVIEKNRRPIRPTPFVLWMLFIASRLIILGYLSGHGSDLFVHRAYAEKVIAGDIPFRDFTAEYPPLAFAFTVAPALLAPSLEEYDSHFRLLCLLVDLAIFATLLTANRDRPEQSLLYIICSTAIGPLLFDRIDIVLGGILLAAMIAYSGKAYRTSLFVLGIAIAFKLIPVVLAPVVVTAEWRRRKSSVWGTVLLLSLPTLLSAAIVIALGGDRLGEMVAYHLKRGIQLESIPASLALLMSHLGMNVTVGLTYGSQNLATPIDEFLVTISTLMGLAAIALGIACALQRNSRQSLPIVLTAVLAGSLFSSKVLSPQYFVFLLPLLSAVISKGKLVDRLPLLALIAILYGLTGAIYPWNYDELIALSFRMELVLLLRNSILGLLCWWLFEMAWQGTRNPGAHDAVKPVVGPRQECSKVS